MLQYFVTLLAIKRDAVSTDSDRGASAVEYGLLVAAIAALIVIVVFALGGLIEEAFNNTCTAIDAGITTTDPAAC